MTANDISDICYSYKYAAHKSEMLQILSELYCCSVNRIKEILTSNGFEIVIQKKRAYSNPWTESEDKIIENSMMNRLPYQMIKERLSEYGYNRTYSAVQNRMKKIRENQKCGKF